MLHPLSPLSRLFIQSLNIVLLAETQLSSDMTYDLCMQYTPYLSPFWTNGTNKNQQLHHSNYLRSQYTLFTTTFLFSPSVLSYNNYTVQNYHHQFPSRSDQIEQHHRCSSSTIKKENKHFFLKLLPNSHTKTQHYYVSYES